MLMIPHDKNQLYQTNVSSVGSVTPGTSVTSGASASTKGTAVQLIASTNFGAWGILIGVNNVGLSTAASDSALDILVGGATEDVLIPNLLCGGAGSAGSATLASRNWFFPLFIPSGTRIAAQIASRRLTTAVRVCVYLFGGSPPPFPIGRKVTTYGISTVPNGTTITPGASGASGSMTQITASTSEKHIAFLPSLQATNNGATGNRVYRIALGVGAATEDEVCSMWGFHSDAAEVFGGPDPYFPYFIDVPAGTRLSLRCSNAGLNTDAVDTAIYAVS